MFAKWAQQERLPIKYSLWWISSISHRQIIFNPWTVSKKEDWAIVFLVYAIMKSVTSDLFQGSHYSKEEQNSQREYWSRLSHITRILYIHIWTDVCWAVYFPPADWKSSPAFLSASIGWLSPLDLKDGWRDLQIDWYKRTQSVNQGESESVVGRQYTPADKKYDTDNTDTHLLISSLLHLCPPAISF